MVVQGSWSRGAWGSVVRSTHGETEPGVKAPGVGLSPG